MSPIRKQLNEMIDCLPEQEQILLLEIVRRFVPDDVATADDLQAIKAADEEYENGEMTDHNNINWG